MTIETDALAVLDEHPQASRIRSRRLGDGVATLIVDVTGLGNAERSTLERELHDAVSALEGVDEVRIAMTASQPRRTVRMPVRMRLTAIGGRPILRALR